MLLKHYNMTRLPKLKIQNKLEIATILDLILITWKSTYVVRTTYKNIKHNM